MSSDRRVSLEDVLEVVSQGELEKLIARRGKVSAAAFLEVLCSDLDDAIGRLEAAAHHYASDGAEKLTHFLAAQLASMGHAASYEEEGGDQAVLKIENRAARVLWIGGASLYRSSAQGIVSLLQLLTRTSGRHAHAGLLLYIRERGTAQIVEDWVQALQHSPRVVCRAVSRDGTACVFTSDHLHPVSMFPITIRHHAVLLACASLLDAGEAEHRLKPLASAAPRPRKKHTILFLAADPLGTDRFTLGREARAIQLELERSGHRDRFELVTRWAAEPLDLLRELRKHRPTVVHFSGPGDHGGLGDPGDPGAHDVTRGPSPGRGLRFQGPDGRAQLVSPAALKETFGAAGASVQVVVLSACYTDAHAGPLLAHVGCVVGVAGPIRDDAARSFATGFYGGLGEGESVAAAYEQGCAAISLEGLRDNERPRLAVREGVDAARLVLAAMPVS